MMYRVIITARVCPILCTRSTACCSTIGFQCGSNTCTLEAEVRLMLYVISQICARNEVSISYPTPPAISEIRNTILEESWWNCCMGDKVEHSCPNGKYDTAIVSICYIILQPKLTASGNLMFHRNPLGLSRVVLSLLLKVLYSLKK
jgi:hypothetical protein